MSVLGGWFPCLNTESFFLTILLASKVKPMNDFHIDSFKFGLVEFEIPTTPVSAQNKSQKKSEYKQEIQRVTSVSKYIIAGTCWVAIDYYCNHVKRIKNPGVYDIDNIIKPTLDSLVGLNGVILDDVLVDRVTVNWIDTHKEDYIAIELRYPDLLFLEKLNLKIVKSKSGWCFPISSKLLEMSSSHEIIKMHFRNWESINTEESYSEMLPFLPHGQFVYFSKIKDRSYEFIELEDLE